jgi:hypothetical protein
VTVTTYNMDGIVRLTHEVKVGGVPTNPSTATLRITPAATGVAEVITSPTLDLTPDATGTLVHDYAYTYAGLHQVKWVTTGPTTSDVDSYVVESDNGLLVSVDEALEHLNAEGIITGEVNRERLQRLCLSAAQTVEQELGRTVVPQTFTETYTGVSGPIMLRHTPVLGITSVTVGGTLLSGANYLLAESGFLYYGSTTGYSSWTAGLQNVVVVYRAGYPIPPQPIRDRALDLVQSRWQSSQQRPAPFVDESFEGGVPTGGPVPAMTDAYLAFKAYGVA